MKKIIPLLALICLLLTACAKSNKEKAEALIENHVKSCLYIPESYESVSTSLDSAFTPLNDPEFHELLGEFLESNVKIVRLDDQIQDEEREISSALSDMSFYSSMYNAHYKFKYDKAKEEKKEHEEELKKLTAQRNKIYEKSKALSIEVWKNLDKEPQFIGYQATHRFRAKNNEGQRIMGDYYYVFDPNISKILLVYDSDSEEFEKLEETLKLFTDQITD